MPRNYYSLLTITSSYQKIKSEVLNMIDRSLDGVQNKIMWDFLYRDSTVKIGQDLNTDDVFVEQKTKLAMIQTLMKQAPRAKVTIDDKYSLSRALMYHLHEAQPNSLLTRQALNLLLRILLTQRYSCCSKLVTEHFIKCLFIKTWNLRPSYFDYL